MPLNVQCSVPRTLPSPISVTLSPSMFITLCSTYIPLSRCANTMSFSFTESVRYSSTLSLSPLMKGSILFPFAHSTTLKPLDSISVICPSRISFGSINVSIFHTFIAYTRCISIRQTLELPARHRAYNTLYCPMQFICNVTAQIHS